MTYPTSLDELTDGVPSDGQAPTTELDDATFPHDDHHRALAVAVEAIETELGTDPSGAEATVKARVAAVETLADAATTPAEVVTAVAAEATLARNADNLTSGTVADARIASTIARDSEVSSAITTHEGLADPHPGYTTSAELDARLSAANALDLTDGGTTTLHSHAGAGVATDTIFDAKGDLVAATAADTGARVAVGADRTLLRSDSNASTGVRWGQDLIRTRSTGWHYNAHLATPASSAWPIIGRAYYVPFFLPGRNVITAVGHNVTAGGTASNTVRIGIYSDSGSFAPGTILDQGTVAGDAIAFTTWTPSSPVAVTDLFWLVACPQGTSTPGSTWLSLFNATGLAFHGGQETGAAWAGTYVSGIARYSAESGAFTNNPSLTLEVQSRNPYLAVRLQ